MKPKAALVMDGFQEPDNGHKWTAGDENKRGRLSAAAVRRCEQLAASGVQIDGYVVSSSNTGPVADAPVVKKVAQSNVKEVADIGEPYRDENYWTASADGHPVGMRTVDNVCGNSLTYCPCPHPRVWVDFDHEAVVQFSPKST